MPRPPTTPPPVPRFAKRTPEADLALSPSRRIDGRIAALGGWRGETLARLRTVIRSASPEVVEDWKWNGPVWCAHGIICTGEAYRKAVKLTFARGAALTDPQGLFNASLDGRVRRAIDVAEGAAVDEAALRALVLEAVEVNRKTA